MSNKSKTARRLAAWTKTVDEFAGDIESLHCLAIAYDTVLWPELRRQGRPAPAPTSSYWVVAL